MINVYQLDSFQWSQLGKFSKRISLLQTRFFKQPNFITSRNVFKQAFDKWSAVIPLNFSYVAYDYDAYMRFAYIDGKGLQTFFFVYNQASA